MKPCKGCGSITKKQSWPDGRPIAGPRCQSCGRAEKKRVRANLREKRAQDVYGLPPGGYEALLASQGGSCAIHLCTARGLSRALAVDHNHETGEVRGLLCVTHNQALGWARDNPDVFDSLAEYLRNPPSRVVLTFSLNGRQIRYSEDVQD